MMKSNVRVYSEATTSWKPEGMPTHQASMSRMPQTRTSLKTGAGVGAGALAARRKSINDDESADDGEAEGTVENEGGVDMAQLQQQVGAEATKVSAAAMGVGVGIAPPVDEADSIYTRYRLNFDPELVEIICESKYMELLGLPVPDLARSVALQVQYCPIHTKYSHEYDFNIL